jgi:hypothetical protein
MEVFHFPFTSALSMKKNTVEANIIAVASQKDIPT